MPAAETVEVVVSVVEVGDTDGFTVVEPLILLAFDIARGFATLSEERVDVDHENRVRAEASERIRRWRRHGGRSQQRGIYYLKVCWSLSRTTASVGIAFSHSHRPLPFGRDSESMMTSVGQSNLKFKLTNRLTADLDHSLIHDDSESTCRAARTTAAWYRISFGQRTTQ